MSVSPAGGFHIWEQDSEPISYGNAIGHSHSLARWQSPETQVVLESTSSQNFLQASSVKILQTRCLFCFVLLEI